MAYFATSSDMHRSIHLQGQIDVDLEARDSTPDGHILSNPTMSPTESGRIQSDIQFPDNVQNRLSESPDSERYDEGNNREEFAPPTRPSVTSIPPNWPYHDDDRPAVWASSSQQGPQPQSQDHLVGGTYQAHSVQRRPSLLQRTASRISTSLGTLRIMSPPSPDDTAKLNAFDAAITNYGTLSTPNLNDGVTLVAPTPLHLRAPAPPTSTPIIGNESAPPSHAGSEVGHNDNWLRRHLTARRRGKNATGVLVQL